MAEKFSTIDLGGGCGNRPQTICIVPDGLVHGLEENGDSSILQSLLSPTIWKTSGRLLTPC